MKTIKTTLLLSCIALSLLSCNKEDEVTQPNKEALTVSQDVLDKIN